MDLEVTPFDVSEYLESDEDIAVFLDDAFQTGDSGYIAHATEVAAKARSICPLAKEVGVTRADFLKTLSNEVEPKRS